MNVDKVVIAWRYIPSVQYDDGDVAPEFWQAFVRGPTGSLLVFNDYNRDEFFARYNALTVEKEDAPNE